MRSFSDNRKWLEPLMLFLFIIAGLALIQFSTPDLPDNDGFYHIKLAEIMRREGLTPEFRWLPLTILSEEQFYDHHFLYHVALIPFTFGDLRLGAKWSAVFFPALSFMAVFMLFRRQRIPYAWLWTLALFAVSEAFLYRMSITRAQSLSLGILALGMMWLLEGRHWLLALLGFLYVWAYNAFPLLLAFGILFSTSTALLEKRFEWKPMLYIAAGIALGLVINPYFPRNLLFTFRHILPKLGEPAVFGLGNEWFPYTTAQLLENSLPALLAFAGGAFAIGLSGRRMEVRTALSFLVSLMFALMLFRSRRFVEYFPPFVLVFAAFASAPLMETWTQKINQQSAAQRTTWKYRLPALAFLLAAGFFGWMAVSGARDLMRSSKPYDLYQDAASWLENNTPADSLVFQTDWDDFPRLFFHNTHNTYLAGLDPTYLQLSDPALYNLWVDITRGRVENPSKKIIAEFGAYFVLTDLEHTNFIEMAESDPAIREVFRDDQAVIFQIIK